MGHHMKWLVGQPILAAAAFQAALLLSATTLSATTFTLTVAGLGGEPDYEQRFNNWARDFEKNVKGAGGDEIKVETLAGPNATKAKVKEVLDRIAREAKSQDSLL